MLLWAIFALITTATAQQTKRELVRQWREGDYVVKQYVVADNSPHQSEYEIHYAINSSTASPEMDQNGEELKRLDSFFSELKQDTLRHVTSIAITGYASPDGTTKYNTELARRRAQQLSTWLCNHYGIKGVDITITSHVVPWSATTEAIEHSSLKDSDKLVKLVNSGQAPMVIDNQLKGEANAWAWLKDDILPDMRRAVITVAYTEDRMESSREYSPNKQQPKEVVIIEEWSEKPKHDEHHKHHKHDKHHKEHKGDKHGKHHRNVVVVDQWEGVVIDLGGETEGYEAR